MATLLVGVMLVAALRTVAVSRTSQLTISDRARGQLLAKDLMAEILTHAYKDPTDLISFIGVNWFQGEWGGPDRANYDDVDDYDNWSTSPPELLDGTPIADLTDWTRSVDVAWVNPADLGQTQMTDTGVKRITVTVNRGDRVVATLTTIRTEAWPDGEDSLDVLMVVKNVNSLNSQETARVALMESWGFVVSLIDDSDTQANFDTAVADNDVAYVSEEVNSNYLGTKLVNTTVGVVNENKGLTDEFGFSSETQIITSQVIRVVDNSHYVTSPFNTGLLTILGSGSALQNSKGVLAPDGQMLSTDETNAAEISTMAVEAGADVINGDTAEGRRVRLPWAAAGFDINLLTNEGQTLMKRAIEWAASKEQP